jgi:hypothetical protein
MNTELIAQAATDKRLSHGSFRLLALIQTSEPARHNPGQAWAEALGVCSVKPWNAQLQKTGYLPSPKHNGGRHRKNHHDVQNENASVCTCESTQQPSAAG